MFKDLDTAKMHTWYTSSNGTASASLNTSGSGSTRVFLLIWALCATIACICISSSLGLHEPSKNLENIHMKGINQEYYKFDPIDKTSQSLRQSGTLVRTEQNINIQDTDSQKALQDEKQIVGQAYESGKKCPYTWHGNGSPNGSPRGSCWCGLDSYCMCTVSRCIHV